MSVTDAVAAAGVAKVVLFCRVFLGLGKLGATMGLGFRAEGFGTFGCYYRWFSLLGLLGLERPGSW